MMSFNRNMAENYVLRNYEIPNDELLNSILDLMEEAYDEGYLVAKKDL